MGNKLSRTDNLSGAYYSDCQTLCEIFDLLFKCNEIYKTKMAAKAAIFISELND